MTSVLSGADEGANVPRIGEVFGSNPSASRPYDQAFRDGLRELGYVEGKNVIILARYANGDSGRFAAILTELIALDVSVLVVTPTAVHAAKTATGTIPIVLPSHGDPVRDGLAVSLARPGHNITGLSSAMVDTDPKRLELAIEVMPNLKRLGLLFESAPEIASSLANESAFATLARRHRIALRRYEVKTLEETESAIKRAAQDRIQAMIVINTSLTVLHRAPIISGLAAQRIPVITAGRDMAETGALLTYSPDFLDMWKRSASYVDRILKGTKPGDLPIEQPSKFDLIINLRTAKALGITIPETVLVRANDLIR